MVELKFLSDNSSIWFILVLASVDYVSSFKLWFSWFIGWRQIFVYVLDILGMMLGNSGSYLNLFQQAVTQFRFGTWLLAYFLGCRWFKWHLDFRVLQCYSGVLHFYATWRPLQKSGWYSKLYFSSETFVHVYSSKFYVWVGQESA